MKILIKQATILDTRSSLLNKKMDILVTDGMIESIENSIDSADAQVLHGENLVVSQGWVDLKANFCDPGEEHKETIDSGLDAAAFGGYTHVAVLPSTHPVVDGKTLVEYILRRAENHVTSIHPIGAITENGWGKLSRNV